MKNVNETDLKVGRLAIALYPTHLKDNDGKVTYHAKVINRDKVTMLDVCNDLVASGNNCGLTANELETIWQNICEARTKRLTDGFSTEDAMGTLYPSVKGSFADDQSSYTKGTQTITVRFRPSEGVSDTMSSLTPVITQGNTCHPVIDCVQDLRTQTDTTLTPGGLLSIRGKNICLSGDDETVGLYFENVQDTEEVVKVAPEDMSTNSKNALCLIIPAGLKDGCRYRLKLITQFSGSSKNVFRKEPQTVCAVDELHVQVPEVRTA